MMISSDESEDSGYSPKRPENENESKSLVEDKHGESETSDSEGSQDEDEASGNKQITSKSESSSVSPQASRPAPAPILKRDYSGRGPVPNQPPESWHLVYDQQQRRQQELLRTVNQRIESQNSHILEMNKYLAQARKVSDQQDEKRKGLGGEN
jgi:hypothetical protein